MPRIPQLTRLKGLSNLPTSISHSPIIPFAGERCTSCQTITISSRRSIPTRFRSSAFIRLYSSEKQSTSLSRGNEDIEVSEDDLPQQWQTSAMPPPRSYAERPDEVLDTAYVPALTSEGLESVGGVENWWEKEAHWPKSADFVGFKSPNKVTDPAVIETSIRQAVVEAFTLSQAGRIADLTRAWPTTEQEYLRRLLEVDIRLTENGGVSLGSNSHVVLEYFDSQNKPSESSNSTTEEPVSEGLQNEPVLSAEEAQVFRGVWGDNWKSIPLSDRQIKFAVSSKLSKLHSL
ncbi:uncharacterized protein F4822DRAFT_408464 [Hypoxylon trugodes]|uniref:uncharacterized protein n=1 Tax=Hypoxylon trugodes TaxID=326681 RepID=UPI00219059F7|nr:uncharacterized protein F4822DRAFT_408464 [Hypoxylon trugodes]KAI1388047.1 hypothetical protein F4822DRAFT_408464 [Hypoxylon trugodes]